MQNDRRTVSPQEIAERRAHAATMNRIAGTTGIPDAPRRVISASPEEYDRAIRRATGMIRRVEREGYGRNGDATVRGIRRWLLTAQRVAARELPADAERAEKFGRLLDRAEAIGAGL